MHFVTARLWTIVNALVVTGCIEADADDPDTPAVVRSVQGLVNGLRVSSILTLAHVPALFRVLFRDVDKALHPSAPQRV
jgi:hypothetical protein